MEEERSFATRALVWPHDASRRLLSDSGTDNWFWIHVAQAIVFTVLAVWAFQRLARESSQDAVSGANNLGFRKVAGLQQLGYIHRIDNRTGPH
jgi:hypothetical protein